MVIPLYTNYSMSKWPEIIQIKKANPNVPIIAIVNPHVGPGTYDNTTFGAGVKAMQAAGVTVLGYEWTDYANKSITTIESDILAYSTWYGMNGVLLDGMANSLRSSSGVYLPSYYANLTAYAKSLGMTKIVGNPGTDVPVQFVGTVDTITIFENGYLPSLQLLGGWHTNYNKTNFAFVSYNMTSFDRSYVLSASNYVGYFYLTNWTRAHYPTLPPYLGQLVSTVASMTTVRVDSIISSSGLPAPAALNASMTQPDGSSVTATTPFTFEVYVGSAVQITVEANGGNTFDYWGDGSTARTITITPQGPTVLEAYVTS